MTERWKDVFHRGFAPFLPAAGLEALAVALETDSPRLCQGMTAMSSKLDDLLDYDDCSPAEWLEASRVVKAERVCAVIYPGWEGTETVVEANERFAELCFKANFALGETAAFRHFAAWVDETGRAEMRIRLLAEVELVLAERRKVAS